MLHLPETWSLLSSEDQRSPEGHQEEVQSQDRALTRTFGAEIIILPWDTNEIYGHTDGIVRFIDDDSVLMTNYAQFDPAMATRFRRILQTHFKNVYELSFKAAKPHKYSWAYINWLQTDKVLILPKFGIPEDQEAYEQISKLMLQYRNRIEMVMPQT